MGGCCVRAVIYSNFDLCSGCNICRMICSEKKTGGTNPRLALLNLEKHGLVYRPVVSAQCRNAFCLKVCPVEAVYRQEDSGAVLIDRAKCTGCGLCAEACPVCAIVMDKQAGIARKCDLCGGDPACVRYCPTGALELVILGGDKDE
jgi:Fe-S-cluster-containing hydrogenase component 2